VVTCTIIMRLKLDLDNIAINLTCCEPHQINAIKLMIIITIIVVKYMA